MSLPLLHAGRTNPGLSAALDLRFALDKSLTAYRGPTPSFSRASTGTYFNSSGVLTSAAINAPRFNHTYNGTSWVSRGLLVEEQRTNGLLRSNEFSNAVWFKLNVAVSTDSTISPDGTTAAKVTPSTSSSVQKAIYQTLTIANSANSHSVYVKAGTQNFIQLMFNGSDLNYANFNISTGVTGNKSAGVSSSSISDVGNGWYRISMTLTNSGATGWTLFWINSLTDGRAPSVTSTGSIYLFGAQYEAGAFPTSYIGTTNSSVVRSADVCQITGGDFSGFWNGTEGSFAVEYDLPSDHLADRGLLTANDGTVAKYIAIYGQSGSGQPGKNLFIVVNSSLQAGIYGATVAANTTTKIAAAWKLNDFASYSQGTAGTPDGTGTIPSPLTQLEIGKGYPAGAGDPIQIGHIARLRYYRKRLPNATLQQLST